MISDLLAFQYARLDENEARAKDVFVCEPIAVKERVLREVAAKRALIAFALKNAQQIDSEWGDCHDAEEIASGQCRDHGAEVAYKVLKPLAAIDNTHPDYRPEWAPEGSSDAR